ncbi:AmmeMemoRadiSam system protein A, partial [Rhodospirillum rubrum]
LTLAAEGIGRSLREGALTAPRLDAEPPPLRENGASFVTLSRAGALRGCIGSPAAYRPLAVDVIANAWAAATRDPRFSRITPSELPALALSVAVLTRPHRMRVIDEDDLIAQLTPGVDGLILSDRGRRGLFLPQVWESLADPRDFVAHLKRKAGFPPDYWSPTLTLDRFTARSVARPFTEPRPPFA